MHVRVCTSGTRKKRSQLQPMLEGILGAILKKKPNLLQGAGEGVNTS